MSFLAPLYALGLLAITAPILFHLIRRTPRGEVPFSSLMFLSPSPPRLTRRSRLENWLLLLLRAAALGLLAFAFARPFLRQAMRLEPEGADRRRIALLIDTSASMRRGDLWPRAKAIAARVIADSRPADQLALFAFDDATRPLLVFDESATLDPARRQAVAQSRLDSLAPGWGATHLGQALIDAVAAIEDVGDSGGKAGPIPRRIVVVGDLQQGGRLEALGGFEWPSDVELDLKPVALAGSNAALHRLADPVEAETEAKNGAGTDAQRRVRVTNDSGSRDRFELLWTADGSGKKGTAPAARPIEVYVPPGESRVVRVPPPDGPAPRLSLKGDVHGFDNTLYFTEEHREEAAVLYLGDDAADDPEGLLYYLQRVFQDTPRRTVRVRSQKPSAVLAREPDRVWSLVVLASETTPENARQLEQYARDGGNVLVVVTAPGRAGSLATIAGVPPWDIGEASVGRDVLLGEIAFNHPLFAPLAGAQFNDFTKIHFWKYRHLDESALGDARVLARFEGGDPAVIEKPIGKGRLVVMASGWQPDDSQLARSSKFVPLMASLLEGRDPGEDFAASYLVHERVPLPEGHRGLTVRKPDGSTATLATGMASFDGTDQPGVYTIETAGTEAGTGSPDRPRSFAVNLDPLESKTGPLHVETLEQFGCRLANPSRKVIDREQRRQMHNAELEARQQLWRWLILAVLGILIVETWLAGRVKQARAARAEVLAS